MIAVHGHGPCTQDEPPARYGHISQGSHIALASSCSVLRAQPEGECVRPMAAHMNSLFLWREFQTVDHDLLDW